jgi:voltage-gated sodium channel
VLAGNDIRSSALLERQARAGVNPAVALCRRLVASHRFELTMLGVILVNAVVLGLDTFAGIAGTWHGTLELINLICFSAYVAELAVRLVAEWPRPGRALKDPWNLFDAIVIAASFAPGVRENVTLLRLVRLLRIVRVVRFLPDLRIIIAAVGRSVPGVAALGVMTLLLIYLYGMIGWVLFRDGDPAHFGDIGSAMLTMFVLLTLENLPEYLERGQELSAWTVPFYLSYILAASFLVFNLFIGIVINSMEDARQEELARANRESGDDDLLLRLEQLHAEIGQIAHELAVSREADRPCA